MQDKCQLPPPIGWTEVPLKLVDPVLLLGPVLECCDPLWLPIDRIIDWPELRKKQTINEGLNPPLKLPFNVNATLQNEMVRKQIESEMYRNDSDWPRGPQQCHWAAEEGPEWPVDLRRCQRHCRWVLQPRPVLPRPSTGCGSPGRWASAAALPTSTRPSASRLVTGTRSGRATAVWIAPCR